MIVRTRSARPDQSPNERSERILPQTSRVPSGALDPRDGTRGRLAGTGERRDGTWSRHVRDHDRTSRTNAPSRRTRDRWRRAPGPPQEPRDLTRGARASSARLNGSPLRLTSPIAGTSWHASRTSERRARPHSSMRGARRHRPGTRDLSERHGRCCDGARAQRARTRSLSCGTSSRCSWRGRRARRLSRPSLRARRLVGGDATMSRRTRPLARGTRS